MLNTTRLSHFYCLIFIYIFTARASFFFFSHSTQHTNAKYMELQSKLVHSFVVFKLIYFHYYRECINICIWYTTTIHFVGPIQCIINFFFSHNNKDIYFHSEPIIIIIYILSFNLCTVLTSNRKCEKDALQFLIAGIINF